MKVSLVPSSRPVSPDQLFSRQASDATVSARTSDSSLAPVADFDYPPEFSSCLDNSAAKHKLLVKPRNQRSSKMRRLSSVIGLLPTCRGGTGSLGSPHSHPPPPLPAQGHRRPLRNPYGQWDHATGAGLAHFFHHESHRSLPCINTPSIHSLVHSAALIRNLLCAMVHRLPTALSVKSTFQA